jgi:hypothetical protein
MEGGRVNEKFRPKGLHYQVGLNILATEKLGPGVPR